MTEPKMVKLRSGEVVYCYNRGSLEKLNPEWDGHTPNTNLGIFLQGFRGHSKYVTLMDELDLNLCLTNQRFFIEPINWGPLIFGLIKVLIEYAPVNPIIKNYSKNGLNEQVDIVHRKRDSGEPIFEICLADIFLFLKDESYYVLRCKINDQETNVYFTVDENQESWDMHLKSMLSS